jgi:hypothetical protein
MILVRPSRTGGIELRTYAGKVNYVRLRAELSKYKNELAPMRWGVWLPTNDNKDGWKDYISRRYALELKLFVLA